MKILFNFKSIFFKNIFYKKNKKSNTLTLLNYLQ